MIKELFKKRIEGLISNTLGQEVSDFEISHPTDDKFGDMVTNVSIKASKLLHRSPLIIAKDLIDKSYKSDIGSMVEKIEVAGPGFINFFLKKEILLQEVQKILNEGRGYGQNSALAGQKIMIEFADPNPFKEFHVGHLRNISLGESLVRLQRALGAEVRPVNYQGDVGLHVAKSLWGLKSLGFGEPHNLSGLNLLEQAQLLGRSYVEGSRAYEGDLAAKEEINAINQAIYQKDPSQPELLELWRVGRQVSLQAFEEIYRRVGTQFKRYYFESEVFEAGRDLVLAHLQDQVFEKSEGAVIFRGEKFGLHTRVFIAKGGYPTYEGKDLGLAPLKYGEFPYDLSIILTGNDHLEYFKVVIAALTKIKAELGRKTINRTFGMVSLKAEKMASRLGNVVTARELIDQAKQASRALVNSSHLSDLEREEIAEKVAVGAVKYSLLKTDTKNDIAFDLKESISLEGNSGPYLQYTYARARSVLRKSQILNPKSQTNLNGQKSNPFEDWNLEFVWDLDLGAWNLVPEEVYLLRTLYKFPEVVELAALQYSPHLLCNFLYDLARKFNLFYNNVKILPEGSATRNSKLEVNPNSKSSSSRVTNYELRVTRLRLALTEACAQILKNGLYLLGVEAPERM